MEDGLSGANIGNWILEVVGVSVFILSSKVMERMKIAIFGIAGCDGEIYYIIVLTIPTHSHRSPKNSPPKPKLGLITPNH